MSLLPRHTGHSARPSPALLAVETGRVMAYHIQCGFLCSMACRELREELREESRKEEQEEEREWRYILTGGKAPWRSCGGR